MFNWYPLEAHSFLKGNREAMDLEESGYRGGLGGVEHWEAAVVVVLVDVDEEEEEEEEE